MNVALGNVRSGARLRALWLIAPATLCALAASGVTLKPALSMRRAEEERDALRAGVRRGLEACARSQRHRERGDAAKLDLALDVVRARIPRRCEPIETHGIVRLAASAVGLELATLSVGADRDLELDGVRDRVIAREVCLRGEGDLTALVRLVATLRALGQPCAALELGAERSETDLDSGAPGDDRFEVHLCLDLFQSTTEPRVEDELAPTDPETPR